MIIVSGKDIEFSVQLRSMNRAGIDRFFKIKPMYLLEHEYLRD